MDGNLGDTCLYLADACPPSLPPSRLTSPLPSELPPPAWFCPHSPSVLPSVRGRACVSFTRSCDADLGGGWAGAGASGWESATARMCACWVYLILRFVQILNRSPPQLKSEASVPIFCGRECLYPIPLFTCLNIYFVNRDVSGFHSFFFFFLVSPGARDEAPMEGRTRPSPLFTHASPHSRPHQPWRIPPSKALPQLGITPTKGRER